MKKLMLFLILTLPLAGKLHARKWGITDSMEQSKNFVYMYYAENEELPGSLEDLEKLAYRKLNIQNYFENQKKAGFNFCLIKLTENLLWLSVENETEAWFFLYDVAGGKQQITVFGEGRPLYRYSITPSGEAADFYAYDKRYEKKIDGYEDIYVPKKGELPQESYEVIEPPGWLCE